MKKLLFLSMVFTIASLQIIAQPKLKAKPVKLIEVNGKVLMNAEWSPDGKQVAFTGEKNNGILVSDAKGRNIRQLSDDVNAGFRFSWSNDGTQILARPAVIKGFKRYYEVVTYDVTTTQRRILVDKTRKLKSIPHWVDGDANVAVKLGEELKKVSTGKPMLKNGKIDQVANVQNELFIGSKNIVLSDPAFKGRYVFNMAQSPDGKKIVFQVNGLGLYVADADGANMKHLGFGEQASWTPDGVFVIVSKVKDNGVALTSGEIVAINVNTAEHYSLLNDANIIALNPAVSPDGKKVLIDNVKDGAIYMFEITQ